MSKCVQLSDRKLYSTLLLVLGLEILISNSIKIPNPASFSLWVGKTMARYANRRLEFYVNIQDE